MRRAAVVFFDSHGGGAWATVAVGVESAEPFGPAGVARPLTPRELRLMWLASNQYTPYVVAARRGEIDDSSEWPIYTGGPNNAWLCHECGTWHIHKFQDGLTGVDDWCSCAREQFFAKRDR